MLFKIDQRKILKNFSQCDTFQSKNFNYSQRSSEKRIEAKN